MTMNLSDFPVLPTIQTRKALLLLDFQNDFVRPSGALHVPNTADFLHSLPKLAEAFSSIGEVFWVRTHYKSRRPLFDPNVGNWLVLNGFEGEDRRRRLPQHDLAENPDDDPVDEEAFLSMKSPKCCLPQSTGAQFPAPIVAAINAGHGTVLEKSDYSVLNDAHLTFLFRTRLITEVYLCGSLSNISVYATALDAARNGYSVVLLEDCLGWRDFDRHKEAMRRMADEFRVNGASNKDFYQMVDFKVTDDIAARRDPRPARSVNPAGLEEVLDELDVRKPNASSNASGQGNIAQFLIGRRLRPLESAMTAEWEAEPATAMRSDHVQSSANGGGTEPRERVPRRGRRRVKTRPSQDLLPGDVIGEDDSRVVHDLELPTDAFEKIRDEVAWQKMYHMSGQVPRLVAVQGKSLADGAVPIYRHPADESPPLQSFTPTVNRIRTIVEPILGHPLNHVLIQLYRDGQDRISEHADKTLDIVRGSFICNVSVGAQRVMILRTKAQGSDEEDSGRQMQRIPLPHESLFVLGEKTNMRWLHGIRPDKRPDGTKSMEERAYGGQRISLTFRHIGTFLSPAGDNIWGQGAVSKTQETAGKVIHGDPTETERLIRAFGQENRETEFDWDAVYGGGFDVVNFVTAETAGLVLSGDSVSDLRVRLCLSENGHRYEVGNISGAESNGDDAGRPLYIGPDGTKVAGDVNILAHLAQRPAGASGPGADMLQGGGQLQRIEELFASWRGFKEDGKEGKFELLDTWEDALDGRPYLGGTVFGIDDCSLWPVLRDISQTNGAISARRFPRLQQYYQRVENRGIVKTTLEESE